MALLFKIIFSFFGGGIKLMLAYSWLHFSSYDLEIGVSFENEKQNNIMPTNDFQFMPLLRNCMAFIAFFNYNKAKWNDYEVQLIFGWLL